MPDGIPMGAAASSSLRGRHGPCRRGRVVTSGWVLEFEPGEAWHLEVMSDRDWSFVLDD